MNVKVAGRISPAEVEAGVDHPGKGRPTSSGRLGLVEDFQRESVDRRAGMGFQQTSASPPVSADGTVSAKSRDSGPPLPSPTRTLRTRASVTVADCAARYR